MEKLKNILFDLSDNLQRIYFPGRVRKNFKSRVEYQMGVKQGKKLETERIIAVLEYEKKERMFRNTTDVIEYLKWLKNS